ncbi:unnamed protein product [Mytilus coruscus]|uniref:Integrase catalytic domain-containing protein n=1 Tax=Mytilus coruscus TaxID=42192 RepID=A0A6J8DPM7_MYTCO|nr:unnamed protein product [Mytilus coruscus]
MDFGKMTISVPNVTRKDSATSKGKENIVSTVTVPTFLDDNVQIAMATTVDLVKIPAQSEIIIPVHVGKFKHGTTVILEPDIFAKNLSELGHTNLHFHTIYTGDAKPISAAPYRQSPQMCRELDKQLDEMERYNIIEESTSPWHSPVVLVKKRNGSICVCVDFRALNLITEPMSAVIPTMTDIFDTLTDSKAEIFSSLDLTSGFWQVLLDQAMKHKSAFITYKGVYEFNRLPFGMMNSPLTFQCLMTKKLKDLNFKIALVYIDDILIFSKTFEDHLNHLQQEFSNLREANLKLNPEKCKFTTRTIKYLGHVISKDGIRVNPENTEKVKDFCRPNTAKQVKSFLGMANYYRKFVKDYAHIAAPLTKLLKKDQRFRWTPECDIAEDLVGGVCYYKDIILKFNIVQDLKSQADCLSRQKHLEINNSVSYDSSELADHLGSIDIQKEYTEVTFIYKVENEIAVISSLQTVTINDIQLTNLAEEQETCKDFADIIKYKQSGRIPQNPELARAVVAESFNFESEDGILKHFYSKRCKKVPKDERLVKQIAVPRNLIDSILKAYHDCILGGGHQGFERTYAAIQNISGHRCIVTLINISKPPPLQPQPTNDIFGRWHMDILSGLQTTKDKYKHVLLVVDSYSKRCESFPLRSEEAGEVANVLYREIISRYGAPRTLLSDCGRNFVSNLVKAFSELFNIKRHLTSSYHPQTNGACERMNSVILQTLRAYTRDQQDDWPTQNQQQLPVDRINNRQQNQQPAQNSETNKRNAGPSGDSTVNAPVKDNKPSCQDCKNIKCKAFKEEEIQQVLSSVRAPNTARQVLIDHKERFKQALLQQDIQHAMEKRLGKENQHDCSFQIASDGKIHEI